MEFWKSRTFWTGIGIILSNLLVLGGVVGWFDLTENQLAAVLAVWNSILGVLAIVFRWDAQAQKLTLTKRG
jgi:hypothetical protein